MTIEGIQLTPEQEQRLDTASRLLHDILPLMDVAQECGIECQQIRQQVKEMQEQIAALDLNFRQQPAKQ